MILPLINMEVDIHLFVKEYGLKGPIFSFHVGELECFSCHVIRPSKDKMLVVYSELYTKKPFSTFSVIAVTHSLRRDKKSK